LAGKTGRRFFKRENDSKANNKILIAQKLPSYRLTGKKTQPKNIELRR